MARWIGILAAVVVASGCGPTVDAEVDAGPVDAGPTPIPPLDHCTFTQAPPTGHAGGTVTSGALSAGVAEAFLDVPLGASLAAYTGRDEGFGADGFIDDPRDGRHTYLSGPFAPSTGIVTIPRIGALALSAGGESVVILKVGLASSYQGFVHDVEAALGPDFSGKVLVATSHSHSSFGNYSGHTGLTAGFGPWRSHVYRPLIAQLAAVAQQAIDALEPAQIGFAYDPGFDPEDLVNRDRRSENDDLVGGPEKDHHLFVIRVDDAAGDPMAVLPVFGIHGTIGGADNPLVSTDSIGGIERVLEESFDDRVVVMHLQGAGGDVSPAGHDSIDCMGMPVCSDFARTETVGIYARDAIMAAWTRAGESMQSDLEMEMLTRTIPLGPDYHNFDVRDGQLEYAEWNLHRQADGVVYGDDGNLVSPIDEFNAPFGAVFCTTSMPALLSQAQMPGTRDLDDYSYRGCNMLQEVAGTLGAVLDLEFDGPPICETTQTTISALRIGDWMLATLPGEPVTQLAAHLRTLSPMPEDHTIVVGYAQDHTGYLLRPEDWLRGGYEPTITFWGPLEAEYITEQSAALMPLAMTPEREDGNEAGIAHVQSPTTEDDFPADTPGTIPVGTVPDTLPSYVFTRLLRPITSAQPAPTVRRFESVFFTWVGDDPLAGTPRVALQRRDPDTGEWADVARRSGRLVQDADVVLTWTPDPIEPEEGTPRTHYYTVEMQAVAPMGMPGLESLAARAGLPLGEYRFRVVGPGYDESSGGLLSDPFTVEAAELGATSAASGSDLQVTLTYPVPAEGYRLLDMVGRSNGPVPLRNATLTVVVDGASTSIDSDENGALVVPGGAGKTVTITDAYGNTVTLAP